MDAPRFTDSQLSDIRSRTSLVRLVGAEVTLKRAGRGEHMGLCPFHSEKTPSFTVAEGKGFYHCFGCGAHGDAFGWVMRRRGVGFIEAAEELAIACGVTPDRAGRTLPPARPIARPARQARADDEASRMRWARDLFAASSPPDGTIAETYLAARGIDPARLGTARLSLRYHPALRHAHTGLDFPAMVAAMKREVPGDGSRIVAVHRTFLAPHGRAKAAVSKAKTIVGPFSGAAIRLDPAGEVLGLAEGIETGCSVRQACAGGVTIGGARLDRLPVWVAGSLGNIAGGGIGRGRAHPDKPGERLPSVWPDPERPGAILPPCVRTLVLLGDGDTKDPLVGEALLERAARRHAAEGRTVFISMAAAGADFNDMLQAGCPAGGVGDAAGLSAAAGNAAPQNDGRGAGA